MHRRLESQTERTTLQRTYQECRYFVSGMFTQLTSRSDRQDQFGNYVLQYILDKEFADLPLLVNQFKGRVVQLSKAKFSSNVIEKVIILQSSISHQCIRVENGGRESMIEELLAPGAIGELIDDPYGNYVVQTALDFATEDQRHHLISEITPYLQVIKARSWYKRVMNKIHNKRGGRNGDDDTGRYEPSRSQAMVPRQYYEDGMHQRMNSDRAIMPPSMHAYTHVPGDRSPSDHYPPGLMHAPPHHADRNGYRPQIHPQAHAQLHQRYSFYPFPPRGPAPHPADFRGNGDY
jgi:Pumilio-family RNA binding repeat